MYKMDTDKHKNLMDKFCFKKMEKHETIYSFFSHQPWVTRGSRLDSLALVRQPV